MLDHGEGLAELGRAGQVKRSPEVFNAILHLRITLDLAKASHILILFQSIIWASGLLPQAWLQALTPFVVSEIAIHVHLP